MSTSNNGNNGGDKLYEQIARGAEATQLVVTDREDLRTQNDRMQAELMLMRERNSQLDSRLRVASAERDHYMRFCVELTANLNNIQTTINTAIDAAKQATYRPSSVLLPQKPDVVTQADAVALEKLIAKLPTHNDGDTDK